MTRGTSGGAWLAFGALVVGLGGCAAPPAPVAVAPRAAGNPIFGTVAAIRVVPGTPAPAGMAAVLAALDMSDAPVAARGTEYVVRRDDGTVAAFGVAAPAAGVNPGDHVLMVMGGETSLIRHN